MTVGAAASSADLFGHGEAFKATTASVGAEFDAEQIGCSLVDATRHDIISALACKRAELTGRANLSIWISSSEDF